jgi:hypothetical protein
MVWGFLPRDKNKVTHMQLSELVKRVRPGDLIRNDSWPKGKTYTVSTEFMKHHTGRGLDVAERNSCPDGKWDGWELAGRYPTQTH